MIMYILWHCVWLVMNEWSISQDQFLQFVVTVATLGVGQPCPEKDWCGCWLSVQIPLSQNILYLAKVFVSLWETEIWQIKRVDTTAQIWACTYLPLSVSVYCTCSWALLLSDWVMYTISKTECNVVYQHHQWLKYCTEMWDCSHVHRCSPAVHAIILSLHTPVFLWT